MDRYEQFDLELSRHTISNVRFVRLKGHYPRLHGRNAVKGVHGWGNIIVAAVIETDKGAAGWGSAVCAYDSAVPAFEKPLIKGMRLTDIFRSGDGITNPEYKAFDIALHDLAGRILGMPVSRIINEHAAGFANVYDGAIYMNDLIDAPALVPIDTVLRDIACDYALGHRAFKIKIGRGFKWLDWETGFQRDIDIVRETARRWPHAQILVDANDGYTPEQMIRFVERIFPAKLFWIEEPFPESEKDDAALKAYLNTYMPGSMIADGENRPDIPKLIDLNQKGLIDVLQPDVVDFGFTQWRKLMDRLVQLGALGSPHAWGDAVKTHYCAHLAAAYPRHVPSVEAVLGETEGVDHGGYVVNNGMMTVPGTPGFGMELTGGEEILF